MSSATPRQMRLALNGAQTDRAGEFLIRALDVEIVLVVVIDILIIRISSHLLVGAAKGLTGKGSLIQSCTDPYHIIHRDAMVNSVKRAPPSQN